VWCSWLQRLDGPVVLSHCRQVAGGQAGKELQRLDGPVVLSHSEKIDARTLPETSPAELVARNSTLGRHFERRSTSQCRTFYL